MKFLLKHAFFLLLLAAFITTSALQSTAAEPASPKPGTYKVDESHTAVSFTVRHLGLSKVSGKFTKFSGVIELPQGSLSSLSTQGSISTESIDTANAKRDKHLRNEDFFDSPKYPNISFKSTGIKNLNGNTFELQGELNMHGVKQPVSLSTSYLGFAADPWGNERIAFEAEVKINRKDFGLTWNKVLETGGLVVGEEVSIRIDVEAVREKEAK